MNIKDLTSKAVTELKALAEKMKIPLSAGAKKSEIVNALVEAAAAEPGKRKKTEAKKAEALKKNARKRTPAKTPEEAPRPAHEWKMPPGAEEPLMAQERVAESKYYTGPEAARPAPRYEELPYGYGEEKIVLMARDPYWAHIYWEMPQARLEREKAWFGWNSSLCLRVYDVTGVEFDGTNALGYFDQELYERAGNWYLDLSRPAHSFCADIGLRSSEGRFLTLVRSNFVTMPRDGVSDVIDEEWMLLEEDYWKIYGFPGGSSPTVREMWRRRQLQGISSPGMQPRGKAKGK